MDSWMSSCRQDNEAIPPKLQGGGDDLTSTSQADYFLIPKVKTGLKLRNQDINDITDFKNSIQPLWIPSEQFRSYFRTKCVAVKGDFPEGKYNNFLLFSYISAL